MYQCKSFYSANKIYPKGRDIVVAAWSVKVDMPYAYDMNEGDFLDLPNMFCLVRTVEGEGIIETVGEKIVLSQNDFIVLRRKDIVRYKSNSKIWSYYWVDFLFFQESHFVPGVKMNYKYAQEEKELFDDLLNLGSNHPNETFFINGLFAYYYYKIFFKNEKTMINSPHTVQFSEISAFIDQKIYSKITVQQIDDFFDLSTRRVHQIICQNVSKSPKQYISDLKIEKAKQILEESTVLITDIADLLGYDSAYHFSASFSKRVGCSPSSYRRSKNI